VIAGRLNAVTASANGVWAVGETNAAQAIILRAVADHWYEVPSAAPSDSWFVDVVATGANTAWAEGQTSVHGVNSGLLMRWNGNVWQRASFPPQGFYNALYGLAAGPAGAIWSVGWDSNKSFTVSHAISMLWNGEAWRKVPVDALPPRSQLDAVTFVPGGTAWAVGFNGKGSPTLLWNGRAWTQVANPYAVIDSQLFAVAATSTSNAWAVGFCYQGSQQETLILHWNGNTWS